ncbi:MAG TPA: 50S ribosomal protein L13 [Bdellovibrionales bacterium]|nr:50S ribosomal protein L13 [Pseudobdellovibrionaceae bacterium]HAG91955.1 50S ribosomal protein L13 [Bdellovibrionales bacterium]|tara:strand:- start:158 stop:589 length:432 start_codon:yes stop_codon:yes gene_type:complete
MKTWNAKAEEVERKWWVIDASGKTLGRMATEIATVLRGKNKAIFTPHVDCGDFVVVINSEKVEMSGNKWNDEKFYSHSRYFGSLKELTAAQLREKDPAQVVIEAVKGMLPKNKLSRQVIKKLKVYAGAEHPHSAQQPEALNIQ